MLEKKHRRSLDSPDMPDTKTSAEGLLDFVVMRLPLMRSCNGCGAVRGHGWCCDYCGTAYSDAPRLYGAPISDHELVGIINGQDIDIDSLLARVWK